MNQIARCAVLLMSLMVFFVSASAEETRSRAREPIVGLPCERCEGVFVGMPETLESEARIGRKKEDGEPMRITGTVFDASGDPAPGVIVYAYHTDGRGIYPPDDRYRGSTAFRHGRLRGWALTDAEGRYGFETIRPGGYPDSGVPAHVHMHVIEVNRCTYSIGDILFEDDPRLTRQGRESLTAERGGSGLVTPQRDGDGAWVVRRDIRLGQNVPGYSECAP